MRRVRFLIILGYISLLGQIYLGFYNEELIYSMSCMVLAIMCFGAAMWENYKNE